MRVGIIAFLHESNTFIQQPTSFENFKQDLLLRGEEVRQLESTHHEVGGFFAGLAEAGIEAVPLFAARSMPYGPVAAVVFDWMLAVIMRQLVDNEEFLDGLLVAVHGAMVAEGVDDADGFWLTKCRQTLGATKPIIGTLDPHGNLSERMVAATDALISYRTNPHLDQRERGQEAATLMARTLRGEVKPTQAAAFPPLIINIERQRTSDFPCRELHRVAEVHRRHPGVLATSVMLGFPYADVPEMGSALIVVTDNDRALAQQIVNSWAHRQLWSNRHQFVGHLIGISQALKSASELEGPICLLDMGDNVGGGSPGDGTLLGHALLIANLKDSFVCLCDPESVQQCFAAGIGKTPHLWAGGKNDKRHGPPLEGDFAVLNLCDGRFEETQVRHGGIRSFDQGPTAVVRSRHGLTLLLNSRRVAPFSLCQLTSCGIQPEKFRILVAKGVHAPVAAYEPVCKHFIRVNTPGVTTADLSELYFKHRRQPMFPFEPDMEWGGGGATPL
ncbi:MAG TPA: M81 family metallopeptidase [Gemmataceae bacterium]|nr:M81 family metallopeptidase [Gemmataceae bacterium]